MLCPRCWSVLVLCYLVWRGIDGSLAQSVTRYQKRKLLHKTQDILTIKPSAGTRQCSKYPPFAGPLSLYSNSEATSVSPRCGGRHGGDGDGSNIRISAAPPVSVGPSQQRGLRPRRGGRDRRTAAQYAATGRAQ